MNWRVRRQTTPENSCKFGLSICLTIRTRVPRFHGPFMKHSEVVKSVHRVFTVEATSEEEAVEIVRRNMRESLEAEGYKVRSVTTDRVERVA
jgi:hypothetical protein